MSRFLSLKWKAVLAFSLILIAANTSLVGITYLALQQQFAQQREHAYQANVQKIRGLVADSYRRLERLASTIPLWRWGSDNNGSLVKQTQPILQRHWRLLQRVWGVERASLYSSDNQRLVSKERRQKTDRYLPWVIAANRLKQTVTALDCRDRCIQYVASPLLVEREHVGVLLLGSFLADTVPAFRQISDDDTDIGIMVVGKPHSTHLAGPHQWLPEWNMRVMALANAERNLPVLRSLSESYALGTELHRRMRDRYAGREYEVRLMPLRGHTRGNNPVRFVVISDITHALSDIQVATQKTLLAGLISLTTSEILLLLLLWTPMARLKRAVLSFPLLVEHAFEQVRAHLSYSTQPAGYRDEIDILNSTAMTLSYQLPALQTEIQARARNLAERGNELARERDFVAELLNTAQVIILTQSAAGRVVMINRQGQALIGRSAKKIVGRPFRELLVDNPLLPGTLQELEKLRAGKQDHASMDAGLRCKRGRQRTVTWFHSRLMIYPSQEAVILSIGHDVTEREQAEQQLAWLADHDSLTKLFNWRRFQHELEQILKASQSYNCSGGLLYLDLDQFKYINDTSGHKIGDALLRMIADRLRRVTRADDVIARLGGDEFAVIIRECDAEEALLLTKKICNELSALELPARGRRHSISASIGITLFPLHGMLLHDLMANAELAMYQAKREGGGRWHLFSSSERARERMRDRVYWKEQVEHALRDDRFLLYFQPVLDIRTNIIGHYEVLLRMRDYKGRIISPGQFIPAAEQSGLIHFIDHWVIRKAIIEQAKLNALGYKVTLSINLSGRVVDDPKLLPLLTGLLDAAAINPASLMFEVTETAAVVDIAAAESLMREIKALGCRFALDDFGVGFSSFFYLKQLPVDYVKIDGTFIRQLATSYQDRVFVKALGEIAKGLGKKVVAEFVEGKAPLALLRKYDVDYAQGYYIGRPTPRIAEAQCAQGKVIWPQKGLG